MFAPNASASGPPGANRGSGSPPVTSVSRVVVAGDAQATTHTSSRSAHPRGRATLFARVRSPAPSFVGDLRARCLAIACLPYRLPRRALHAVARLRSPEISRRVATRVSLLEMWRCDPDLRARRMSHWAALLRTAPLSGRADQHRLHRHSTASSSSAGRLQYTADLVERRPTRESHLRAIPVGSPVGSWQD